MMRRLRSLAIGGLAALALSGCGAPEEPKREDYSRMSISVPSNRLGMAYKLNDMNGDGLVDSVTHDNSLRVIVLIAEDYNELAKKNNPNAEKDTTTPVMTPQLRKELSEFYAAGQKASFELDKVLYTNNGGK